VKLISAEGALSVVVASRRNAVSLSVFNREWTQINANKTFEIKMLW
jgi:hypothetical protein